MNAGGWPSRLWRCFLIQYWCGEWKSIVFVVALFQLAKPLTDLIDGHAFVFIFQLGQVLFPGLLSLEPKQMPHPVAVVAIDDETFKREYAGRSPLNRCVLHDHLKRIYAGAPKGVIVDLDLSPAPNPPNPPEGVCPACDGRCQEKLENLIRENRDHTVLIRPFGSGDAEGWKGMEGVRFGDASVPVSLGLAVKGYVGGRSLVGVAAEVSKAPAVPHGNTTVRIDPRLYLNGFELMSVGSLPDSFKEGTVVFFGAAYGGEADLFLTPVAEVYGVELHAAAFQSRSNPTEMPGKKFVELLLDVVLGVLFGFVSSFCWKGYLTRVARRGAARQTAGLFVLMLLWAYIALAFLSLSGAGALLLWCGFWLSPIPMAAGMFVDGFVSGAPAAAADLRHRQRHARRKTAFRFLWGEAIGRRARHQAREHRWKWRCLRCWAPLVITGRRWIWLMVVIAGSVAFLFCD